MLVLEGNCIYFDVDDTLVMWPQYSGVVHEKWNAAAIPIASPFDKKIYFLVPHERHITLLRKHKKLGKFPIVVWSQGGGAWAEAVVVALGLSDVVDVCMSKPQVYYDDLFISDQGWQRKYLEMK